MFRKVVVVRYEDMMQLPRVVVKDIARSLGVAHQIDVQELPTSIMDQWREEAHDATYRQFKCAEVRAVCAQVNKKLLFKYGYHGCQSVWPGYSELLRHPDVYQRLPDPMAILKTWPTGSSCFRGL